MTSPSQSSACKCSFVHHIGLEKLHQLHSCLPSNCFKEAFPKLVSPDALDCKSHLPQPSYSPKSLESPVLGQERYPAITQGSKPPTVEETIMEALCNSEDMLAKANQLWMMLDDMAESNPESYHQFMQQQLKDAKQHYAPAEPYMCLKTCILDPTEKPLFVNLCRWNQVPAPKLPSDPVPLVAGKMEEVSEKSEFYTVLDIAYNQSVIEKGKDDPTMKYQLIHLSLKYIEEHYNIILSNSYTITKFKLKGSLARMRQSLRREQAPVALSQKTLQKEVTLDQLRNVITKEDKSDLTLLMENMVPSKTCLIEEISTTEQPEELCTPAYEVTIIKDTNEKPLKIELKVELPEVHSVSECDLSVSEDDVLIECPAKYKLHLDLPQSVNEEATTAAFHSRKRVLLITMPVSEKK